MYPHFVARADEWLYVDDQTGFKFRRLHHGAGRRFLNAGLGVNDREVNRVGDQNTDGLLIVILDFHRHVGNEVVLGVSDDVVLQSELLVVLRVHEVVAFAVAVEVVEIDFVHCNLVEKFLGAEPMVNHGAVAQVAHLGRHGGALIPRRAMVHAIDRVEVAVVLDDHPRAQKCCLKHECS